MDGSVDIEGSVSYASQDPWIFSGTIKENILFGQEYDKAWYDRVMDCCSLVKVCCLFFRRLVWFPGIDNFSIRVFKDA